MAFYAVPYEIHFDDTMAYGSHHFLANFKFQCAGREHLLFSEHLFRHPDFQADFDQVLLLTYEGYSRNLAPARLGDRLVVLVSVEERGEVGLRFCFRTLRSDGEPVAAGYQTILCAARETGALTPFPPSFRRRFDDIAHLGEPDAPRSFKDQVHTGGRALQAIFSPEVRALATSLLDGGLLGARIVSIEPAIAPAVVTPPRVLTLPENAVAFLLAGQGTFDPALLAGLVAAVPEAHADLAEVVEVVSACLGLDARPLFSGSADAAARAVEAAADLDQIGIFVAGALGARLAERRGLVPHVVLGHSFGEIAALTVGGAFDLRLGARVVCERVKALRAAPDDVGTLAAVGLGRDELAEVLAAGRFALGIAGANHATQTVVAGPRAELERLREHLARAGRPLTFVASRYPFHSPALAPAAAAFAAALRGMPAEAPALPVWSAIEGGLYEQGGDVIGGALASQLVRPFDCASAAERLWDAGARHFFDCGTRGRLGRIVEKALGSARPARFSDVGALLAPAVAPAVVPAFVPSASPAVIVPSASVAAAAAEHPALEPVAIVSLGCVLPGGARDPDAYWAQIRAGGSGIVDQGAADPTLVADFLASGVVPDRAYTLLAGMVDDADLRPIAGVDADRFAAYGRGQKLLALALAQCLGGLAAPRPAPGRVRCLVGSTGDGFAEYDRALSVEAALHAVGSGATPGGALCGIAGAVRTAPAADLAPFPTLGRVLADQLGDGVDALLLDAACASSLYTVGLGATLLQTGAVDLVLAGGVFSPGPGNNCLFSQFKGLSARGSRPFDQDADGVIFGEGAGMVGLKRLSDAVRDGDTIHAVVRGVGLSSDGRSSSANVPRSEGQVLAMERCYADSGVAPATVQVVEAHGTATPAGDSTELKSLARFFGDRATPLEIASVKALIGHVGWAAGTASLIKLCLALRHHTIPRQYNFDAPGAELAAIGERFVVSRVEHAWPANGPLPRRAATNGFGFGGTNAHVVLEEYVPAFHAALVAASSVRLPDELVVVAAEGLFPGADGAPMGDPDAAGPLRFGAVPLPATLRLLPDIAEDMDVTQGLAVAAIERLLRPLLAATPTLRGDTSLVLGIEGKTARGVEATARVLAPVVGRLVRDAAGRGGEKIAETAAAALRQKSRPSGPYTLQGMMPNVTPGRVANLLDLKGPNFVVDTGRGSLAETLHVARTLLASGTTVAVAGALHAASHAAAPSGELGDRPVADAAVVLALMTPEAAARLGVPTLCRLRFGGHGAVMSPSTEPDLRAAEGARALLRGVRAAAAGGAVSLALTDKAGGVVVVHLAAANPPEDHPPVVAPIPGFAHGAAVSYYAPTLVERPASGGTADWRGRRVLLLGDDALTLAEARSAAIALGATVRVAHPPHVAGGGVAVDPGAESLTGNPSRRPLDASGAGRAPASVTGLGPAPSAGTQPASGFASAGSVREFRSDSEDAAAAALAEGEPDLVVAVASLDGRDEGAVLARATTDRALLELLFAATRANYARIGAGAATVATLAVGGLAGRLLHPATGLYAGLLKSVAREVPAERVRMVSTPAGSVAAAIGTLAIELSGPSDVVEVAWDGPTRLVRTLAHTPVHAAGAPLLGPDSVVLATGGARGVTAVLVAGLLTRFGCTVVLVGRTDPAGVPERYLRASEAALDDLEREFYAESFAREPGVRPPELRRRFDVYRAANELARTLDDLRRQGRVRYLPADVTSAADVDSVVDTIRAAYGRLDLVVHGAGVQTSKKLDKRKLPELRRTLDTKLTGLALIERAATRAFATPPRFHVLTSAFSYYGNDGQADYGAANETLDRLCAWRTARLGAGAWTSVGWLAWDRIGMTKSSEYSVLGAARGLHGVRADEGAALFLSLVEGTPSAAVNIQMTPGERAWYGIDVAEAPTREVRDVRVDATLVPCLPDHQVRGVPTLPGAWALDQMAAAAASAGVSVDEITNIRFSRFVRVKPGAAVPLRAEIERTGARGTVRLVGDLVHPSGVVLERDVLYAQASFGPRGAPVDGTRVVGPTAAGVAARDPYTGGTGAIRLEGIFACLSNITLEADSRHARFDVPADARARAGDRLPALLLDAAWRLSAMHAGGMDLLFAPVAFGRIQVDETLTRGVGPLRLTLRAGAPRLEGVEVRCGMVEAVDEAGRVVVRVEDGLARVLEA